MIDVHHTILPLTARPKPDAAALIADSLALPGTGRPGLRILSPADMIVHAAAHLFADGDLAGGLRNLWDIDRLLRRVRHRRRVLAAPARARAAPPAVAPGGARGAARPRGFTPPRLPEDWHSRPPLRRFLPPPSARPRRLGAPHPRPDPLRLLPALALDAHAAADAGAAFVDQGARPEGAWARRLNYLLPWRADRSRRRHVPAAPPSAFGIVLSLRRLAFGIAAIVGLFIVLMASHLIRFGGASQAAEVAPPNASADGNADAPEEQPPPAPAPIVISSPPANSRIDYARLDQRLQRLASERTMVGLAVGVVENGEIRFLKGYGTTQAEAASVSRPRRCSAGLRFPRASPPTWSRRSPVTAGSR